MNYMYLFIIYRMISNTSFELKYKQKKNKKSMWVELKYR